MISCIDVVSGLSDVIDNTNTKQIKSMIAETVEYKYVCILPQITYNNYFTTLKTDWESIINNYVNKPDKCTGGAQQILFVHELMKNANNKNALNDMIKKYNEKNVVTFNMTENIVDNMKQLATIFSENCKCQMMDIFIHVFNKYKYKYKKMFDGKSNDELKIQFKKNYDYVKNMLQEYGHSDEHPKKKYNVADLQKYAQLIEKKKMEIFDFSIENELGKLIPDEMGPIKHFFIKVISSYYENLHPIMWAQIFKGIINNVLIDLPLTPDEIFRFMSKQLLLNSGPFILKILQLIRPALSDVIKTKYNLTKLTYPLLTDKQIQIILKRTMINYDTFKIIANKSASVGHVCIGYDVKDPSDIIVIKIIKPLAIAQSCCEYNTLKTVFPKHSCEYNFLVNTLRSNGAEMNVNGEIENLNKGYDRYSSDYNNEFAIDVDAKLSTIQHRENIIKPGTWFVLATTLAEGIPLSDLIESKILDNDTKYRANLHRCLDILVSRFFYVLGKTGYYHGDLHAGNVFYSFKRKQLTMIDFGSMGDIDLLKDDPSIFGLLVVIIMSTFHNFDGMFDTLTDILNTKCRKDKSYTYIDKKTNNYINFKKELKQYRYVNIRNQKNVEKKSAKYVHDLFDDSRVKNEQNQSQDDQTISYDEETMEDNKKHAIPQEDKTICDYVNNLFSGFSESGEHDNDRLDDKNETDETNEHEESIYDYLEKHLSPKEKVVENREILPVFTDVEDDTKSHSFEQIIKMIIEFYANNNVNVIIKFSELNELQKAYGLLLGILKDTGYSGYRMSMAIKTGIMRWGNLLNVVSKPFKAKSLFDVYRAEQHKYKNIVRALS